jgi:hypothetical protein
MKQPLKEASMDPGISLHISTATMFALADYLREYGDERDPSQIATLALNNWLAMAKGTAPFTPSLRGYQWKNLFLPEHTEVRMQCGANTLYARVDGDALVYDGLPISPSQFAGLAGLRRSAWRDLWIRMPGSRQWKKAAFLRIEQNRPPAMNERPFRVESPETASAMMASSLKNALALVEKATTLRQGIMSRRTDMLPDD